MPLDDATRAGLADELYAAFRDAEPIDPLTDRHELDVADAYDIQTRLIDQRLADGASVVGHKVGLTSDGIQEQLGVDRPDFGRVLDTMFRPDGVVPTGDLIVPRIEPEVGFLMAEGLEPPVTHLDVLAATEAVLPVLEIIDSRVRDWQIELEDTIADNASSALYVAGGATHTVEGRDLSLEGVKLRRNGEVVSTGVGAAVLDHPAKAVAWLANTLGGMDASLGAGDIVLSGSVTPAVDLAPGDVFTAEFTTIGTVTARAEDA
ncbi:MAG: fumarylacetoacetate hydrolase family protein [Halobacteriales archaeon]|nr:fumarylacetoacetate hydrolase family protein [Halobacteriales archaeon]